MTKSELFQLIMKKHGSLRACEAAMIWHAPKLTKIMGNFKLPKATDVVDLCRALDCDPAAILEALGGADLGKCANSIPQ